MRKRQAFTLVEMMVSMALVIFIMVLLSQAVVASMQTFRQLKGIGDMEEKLPTAAAMRRRDLGAYYVLDQSGQAFRLSSKGTSSNGPFNRGPAGSGYFRIIHGSPIMRPSALNPTPRNTYEEWDGDGIPSARVTDHAMAFTMRLIGN